MTALAVPRGLASVQSVRWVLTLMSLDQPSVHPVQQGHTQIKMVRSHVLPVGQAVTKTRQEQKRAYSVIWDITASMYQRFGSY